MPPLMFVSLILFKEDLSSYPFIAKLFPEAIVFIGDKDNFNKILVTFLFLMTLGWKLNLIKDNIFLIKRNDLDNEVL